MLLDRQGRCLASNSPGRMLMKLSAHQFIGHPFRDIWPEDSRDFIDRQIESVLRGEHCSFDIQRMNGDQVGWWNVKMAPVRDNRGRIEQFVAISSDITEHKLNLAAIQESEERFRQMANMLPVALFEMDTGGTLTYANRAAFEYFGLDEADLAEGINGIDLLAPQDQPRALAMIDKIIAGTCLPRVNEYMARRKDGSLFPALFRSALMKKGGKPAGFRGVIVNISEKKRLEEQLSHAQRMEAVASLAGGIAHDFNNILNAIIGYAELGMLKAEAGGPEEDCFREIQSAGDRASELIQQILTFSSQGEDEFAPVQVQTIVKEVVKLLRATIPATIDIRTEIAPDCEFIQVLADRTQLHQVLLNLCTNAYQAMKEQGGLIRIRLGQREMALGNPGRASGSNNQQSYLELTVEDNGPGMAPHVKQRIFDPYFTTKRRGEGSGLGLSVVHGIVEKHNGRIEVDTEEGCGSLFRVLLPIIAGEAGETKTEAISQIPGGKERILLVDDEKPIVSVNQTFLTSLGYEVTDCCSSPDALQRFLKAPSSFDLVLTDMAMPHLSGVELACKIFQIRPGLPVILCTGYSENIDRDRAKQLGIRELVMKPLSLPDLARIVRKTLDGGEDTATGSIVMESSGTD